LNKRVGDAYFVGETHYLNQISGNLHRVFVAKLLFSKGAVKKAIFQKVLETLEQTICFSKTPNPS